MTIKEINTYATLVMSKFKGLRPGEGTRPNVVTSAIRKAYPMEYRSAISVYILLLVNDYLHQDDAAFVKLTEKGYSVIQNSEVPLLYMSLPNLCDLQQKRDKLYYQLWEYIGEKQNDENPFYVKGPDFFNAIKPGVANLPANYTLFIESLPDEPNGTKPSRAKWYKSLFMQLSDDQILPFLDRLSDIINQNIGTPQDKDELDILLEETEPKNKEMKPTQKPATAEEKLINALTEATELFSIQWVHVGKYIFETTFNGTLYQVYVLIKPYSESHEYFSYGLDVYHDAWVNIITEEEDPESTLLTPLGEKMKRLFELSRTAKHYIEGESKEPLKQESQNMENPNVFIVHGHDSALRTEVELFLTKLSLKPIVLFKEANQGATIIEKFMQYASKSSFAIVLYTSCDLGKDKNAEELQPRARQNVVFEHGFMYSYLGRNKVVALVEDGVEIPGDLSGVIYITKDPVGKWKAEILKELQASGIPYDKDKVIDALS